MRPTDFLTTAFLFAATCTAWPWPSHWQAVDAVKRELAPLVVRAQTSYDLSFSGTQGNTATTESTSATSITTTASGSGSGSKGTSEASTGKTTGTAKSSGHSESGNHTTQTTQTHKTFSANLPAGGISMITPNALSSTQYYRIGDYVTFAWNYTSLSVTPSAVDILASCTLNAQTYTIAMNQSVPNGTQAVTWDTNQYQQTASVTLLTASYTLIVYDAAQDVSATPSAGYLGVSDNFQFGMYVAQGYSNSTVQFQCATCNAAVSTIERQAMGFIFGMAAVTVLSASWFAGVAGWW